MPDDAELLLNFVERGSDEAFQGLVERHSGMIHGAAFRIVRDESMAEEVTQAVFIILARKARSLRNRVLAGWLYRTACFVALEALRAERRRQQHAQAFAVMRDTSEGVSTWNQIAPVLDEAMSDLSTADRDAVVLRFLEQRTFAEVARTLSVTEAAAKMRVGRALEKLRAALARCGVTVPAAALLTALSACGATAAPASVLSTATAQALAPSAVDSSTISLVKGALAVMAWNKAKAGIGAFLILLLLGGVGVAVWKSSPPGNAVASHLMQTFEPMAGEWEGTFTLTNEGRLIAHRQPSSMSVTTQQGGRACQIELRLRFSPDQEPVTQYYSHALNERGDSLFTISDPASGRGNGECQVTESVHNPATGEWRAAMRFPLPDQRGVMEGSWERRGDTLIVRSHDELFTPEGSSHTYAELLFRRRTAASAAP